MGRPEIAPGAGIVEAGAHELPLRGMMVIAAARTRTLKKCGRDGPWMPGVREPASTRAASPNSFRPHYL